MVKRYRVTLQLDLLHATIYRIYNQFSLRIVIKVTFTDSIKRKAAPRLQVPERRNHRTQWPVQRTYKLDKTHTTQSRRHVFAPT